MLIAFAIDQLQQMNNKLFKALVKHLKTRKKLWEAVRHVFTMICVDSMQNILSTIAKNWKLSYEDP